MESENNNICHDCGKEILVENEEIKNVMEIIIIDHKI